MRRYFLAAAALLTLYVAACSIEQADARPLPAHHSVAAFGPGHCLPTGVWQATLTVTSDVPGGTAHLHPQGVTGFDLPMNVSNVFSIGPNVATYTVDITVTWPAPDDFVSTLSATATRPADGCTVPTTSTTTCEQAIPPSTDCGTSTSEVTTSTLPSSTTSSIPSTSSLVPPTTDGVPTIPTSATSAPKPSPRFVTTSAAVSGSLPATGSSPWTPAGIAVGLAGAGVLLLVVRRKGMAE